MTVIIMTLVTYTLFYVFYFIHKPVVYSSNPKLHTLSKNVMYPFFFLPFGLFNTFSQILRKVKVNNFKEKRSILLDVDENEKVRIDIYEPAEKLVKVASLNHVAKPYSLPYLHLLYPKFLLRKTIGLLKSIYLFLKSGRFAFSLSLKQRKHHKSGDNSLANYKFYKKILKNFYSKNLSDLLKSRSDLGCTNIHSENSDMNLKSKLIKNEESSTADFSILDTNSLSRSKTMRDNVILFHGLNGTSNSSSVRGMCKLFLSKGLRVFCFNVRGALTVPNTDSFNHIGDIRDVKTVVNYVLQNYEGRVSLIGFSMGANWIAKYLGSYKNNERILLGVGVCCPFDYLNGRVYFIDSLYKKMLKRLLAWNYKKYLKRSLKTNLDLSTFKSIEEIDQFLFTKNIIDYQDIETFYYQSSSINYLNDITNPVLFINAIDDPIIPNELVPTHKSYENKNLSFIQIKGGHLGFLSNNEMSLSEMLVDRYYDIISNQ